MNNILNNIDFTDSLALLRWADGSSGHVYLKNLRLACPCAFCSGEKDVLGNVYKGDDSSLVVQSFNLTQYNFIGQYGVRFVWGDGHKDGIFTFKLLKQLASLNENS